MNMLRLPYTSAMAHVDGDIIVILLLGHDPIECDNLPDAVDLLAAQHRHFASVTRDLCERFVAAVWADRGMVTR